MGSIGNSELIILGVILGTIPIAGGVLGILAFFKTRKIERLLKDKHIL